MANVFREFKNQFADKVLLLIIILILPINVALLASTQQIAEGVENRASLSLQNVADIFMSNLDSDMERIDYYLYNSCVNDVDFLHLARPENDLQYENAKYRCQINMQQEIALSGNCDAMFVYNPKREEYIIGTSVGKAKSVYNNFLDNGINVAKRWQVQCLEDGQYLVRVTRIDQLYCGAFIRIEDQLENVRDAVNFENCQVDFINEHSGNSQVYLTILKESARADVSLMIRVERDVISRELGVWEKGLMILSVLFLGMIPLLYFMIQKWVLLPLKIENMEKELAKKKLQLNNLQLQIRPHFLLNTFNIMYNLASAKENDSLKELILYLSYYFRHIFRSGKDLEMFQKELALIEGYLKVAKIRYPDMLEFSSQIDPEVMFVRVPPLLIHNFVENAVIHGMVKSRVLHIMLTAEYDSGRVCFTISDDGAGMTEEEVRQINEEKYMENTERMHVGLNNSSMRLKFFYGETAKIRAESEEGNGTMFIVSFPYNLEETE